MATIRIMSNNQWNRDANDPAWEARGEDCSAVCRSKGLIRMTLETLPDLIGLQEMTPKMIDEHVTNLAAIDGAPHYTFTWGRFTPLMYRSDKLELLEHEFFTYPLHIPGFEGEFNDVRSKSYSIGVFREKSDGGVFIFATTHLWWMTDAPEEAGKAHYRAHSGEARAYQIGLLLDKIDALQKKYDCPALVCGDLNDRIGSPVLNAIFARGYEHCRELATDYADQNHGHHFCYASGWKPYEPQSWEQAIDHMLVRGDGMKIRRFDRFYKDWYGPLSDHLPVFVDVEV